jgi:hypothetical protein
METAVSESQKQKQHMRHVAKRNADIEQQLKGQVRDLTILVALHAKANKQLQRDLSNARDQIGRLLFEEEALEWINKDESILPTRKRSSPTENCSRQPSQEGSMAAQPTPKRRKLVRSKPDD